MAVSLETAFLSPEFKSLPSESRRKLLRHYYKNNFHALVWLLGYRDIGEFHRREIEEIGRVKELTDEPTRRMWLWSRGFFKTSLITESHCIWLIINNPDIRILLVSNTIGVSADILRNIKNQFIGNEDFRWLFPEFCPVPNKAGKIEFGTSEEFTIPCRGRARKEPTMMCAGVGTNLTGYHFDYIKCDDLVTKDSVSNDTQIEASKEYYGSLRHLFDKAAVPREDIVGTIYHFNDLYCNLRKSGLFKESFIPAKIEDKAVFPERLNDEKLEQLVSDPSVGPYQFQTQYMLNPINPAEAKFKEEWLNGCWREGAVPEGCAEYILCDPASTQKKKSDYTVIERWAISSDGYHYFIEGIRDKLTAFQRIDKLFEMVRRSKNLKWVSYEVIGGRHGDLEVIRQRQQLEQCFFFVKEIKAATQSKRDRIEQRLVPLYHNRTIKLPRESFFKSLYDGKVYNFVELLRLEYLQFPFTEHDDILDCQAQIMEEQLVRGEPAKFEVKKEGMTGDDMHKMYAYLDKNYKKYGDVSKAREAMFMGRMKRLVRKAIV